ncbi:ATP-binding cassette domain-containing protein, partial [Pseudoalteromonas sp. SIMBA_148]
VRAAGTPVFSARDLRIAQGAKPISLELGAGEIVAVTGLVGVGKTQLAETLFGIHAPLSGTMELDGRPYAPKTPQRAIRDGVFL